MVATPPPASSTSSGPGARGGRSRRRAAIPAEEPLFPPPRKGSVWEQLVFKPQYDPWDFAQTLFHVRTKSARVVPFRPFVTQQKYVERMGKRNTIVKPRQVGMSTANLAILTANGVLCPNLHTMIVTHRDDTTAGMRQTIQNFLNWANDYHRFGLEIGRDNENELEIKTTGSWFYFNTAGGKGSGRSRTIQQLLCSELAHWNVPNPGAELGGMVESVPDDGLIVIESTPNGAEGPFYETYTSDTSYVKHFFPWFIEPSRRIPLGGHRLTLSEEEALLAAQHSLSDEQIAWRRVKIRDLSAAGLEFTQEYPEDDVTCFTAGLRSYYPGARLTTLLRLAMAAPPMKETVKGDPWDPGGELRVWEPPRAGMHYVVGCDVGGGHRDGDKSYAVVRCHETGQVVATLCGHWKPQRFADLTIDLLALRYNEAYLAHEANGLGEAAVHQAALVRKYGNYHWEKRASWRPDSVAEEWSPGFYVTANARTPLLNMTLQEVLEGQFRCLDIEIVRQMTAARLEQGKSGGGWADKVAFPKSVHDDGIMAYAQAKALSQVVIFADNRARPMQGT